MTPIQDKIHRTAVGSVMKNPEHFILTANDIAGLPRAIADAIAVVGFTVNHAIYRGRDDDYFMSDAALALMVLEDAAKEIILDQDASDIKTRLLRWPLHPAMSGQRLMSLLDEYPDPFGATELYGIRFLLTKADLLPTHAAEAARKAAIAYAIWLQSALRAQITEPPAGPAEDCCAICGSVLSDRSHHKKHCNGPFPASWWHEDDGDVLWWCWRDGQWLEEAPYLGSPLDLGHTVECITHQQNGNTPAARFLVGGWPGYHTHWTRLPVTPPAPQYPVEE